MAPMILSTLPSEVLDTRNLFQNWRTTRKPGSAMPDELWTAAVRLARTYGLSAISRSLPIDYGALKKRMEAEDAGCTPRFIELKAIPVAQSPIAEGSVVDLVDADGAKMTIRLAPGASVNVAELVSAFRRRSP